MRRILALVLACLMVLSLAACGSSSKTETPPADTSSNTQQETSAPEAAAWEPEGSIDFVCPYSAGGGSDTCARTIATVMANYTDANAVVQNLSGGGGLVGTSYVYGKAGDDMTLCTYAPGQLSAAIVNNSECGWDALTQICLLATEEQTLVVQPGKFNCPGQVVIAGDTAAVEKAEEFMKEAGAKKVVRLAVSVPSHCPLMKPAADKLKEKLLSANFSAPKFRVFNNVDARAESDPEKIRDALVRQLCNPVRWTETVLEIKKLFGGEEGTFLEFGPGKVLTGLLRRIDRSLKGTAVNTDETVKEVTE